MSLIKSSLWNWLQGFPCKNIIKLFLHTSCFINTVFFLLCLWWKYKITWKWNIKMLIRKPEMIWNIVTAVQINVMDTKIVSRQNFDCHSVFRLHKPFWLLPYSHAFWVVLISCFEVQNSFIIQLSKQIPSSFKYFRMNPWPEATDVTAPWCKWLNQEGDQQSTVLEPVLTDLAWLWKPLSFVFFFSWKRHTTSRT